VLWAVTGRRASEIAALARLGVGRSLGESNESLAGALEPRGAEIEGSWLRCPGGTAQRIPPGGAAALTPGEVCPAAALATRHPWRPSGA
jgi:hypothetical protein